MGLDSYLHAERYASGYSFSDADEKATFNAVLDASGLRAAADPETPSLTVRVTVAYWRKANHIHRWFVENVQSGNDDCKDYYVPREKLLELRDICAKLITETKLVPGNVYAGTTYDADHPEGLPIFNPGMVVEDSSLAETLLPTASGFFFGGTDYDEYYLADCKDTINQIDRALANTPEDTAFYYNASW